ncbi:MAG: type II secretion system protein [Oscillospiraceae bacterium]|nr:type II secretion system protein [Oscillospiraceae bacterium]
MNSKILGSKVKGFTLIEMIVVMAIIAVLAGISSIIITGFQRDARMETNDNKAHMVYTGMQNQVIQCEIKQDQSLFHSGKYVASPVEDKIVYTEVYFQMEAAKVSDNIAVASRYDGSAATPIVAYAERGDADTGEWFTKLENAILSFIDPTFEGACAVYIDYENYTVDSVIYVENAFFNASLSDYTSIQPFMSKFDNYADEHYWTDANKKFRILNTGADQLDLIEMEGIYCGAYPVADDYPASSSPSLS